MNPSLTWFSYQHWSPALFLVWWCRSFFSCYLWNICLLLQIIFLPQSFHVMQICWNIFLVEKQTVNIFLTLKYPSSEPWKWSFHSDAPVHHHKNWTMCSYQTQVILDSLWICEVLSQSKSKSKSKVQSWKDLEWLYSAVVPPTTQTFLSNQTSNWAQIFTVDFTEIDWS